MAYLFDSLCFVNLKLLKKSGLKLKLFTYFNNHFRNNKDVGCTRLCIPVPIIRYQLSLKYIFIEK